MKGPVCRPRSGRRSAGDECKIEELRGREKEKRSGKGDVVSFIFRGNVKERLQDGASGR